MQHAEAALAENDLGRVTGDVGGAHDGDADIRRMKRRRVVDPVAHESDHVAAVLERENDAVLLRRRQAGEEGPLPRPRGPSAASSSRSMSIPGDHVVPAIQAKPLADVAGDQRGCHR